MSQFLPENLLSKILLGSIKLVCYTSFLREKNKTQKSFVAFSTHCYI